MGKTRKKNNVLSLHGATPPIPVIRVEVVAQLEGFLALAKDGQIHGLLFGVIRPNRTITVGWAGDAGQHEMGAAAAKLNWMMQAACVAGDE